MMGNDSPHDDQEIFRPYKWVDDNDRLKTLQNLGLVAVGGGGGGGTTILVDPAWLIALANSHDEVRNTSPNSFNKVMATGAVQRGDGGGGLFYWDPLSVDADNGGNVLASNLTPNGRWIRLL